MKFGIDVDKKVKSIDQALYNKDSEFVIKETSLIFEYIIRTIFQQMVSMLSFEERKQFLDAEEKIGKGKKGFESFGFGELIGLENRTNLIDKWAKTQDIQLDLLSNSDLNKINTLRTQCVHASDSNPMCITHYEAEMVFNYLKYFLTKLGIVEIKKDYPTQSSTSNNGQTNEKNNLINKLLLSVNDLYPYIEQKVSELIEAGDEVEILNYGLDLETVWPNILVKIFTKPQNWKGVTFKGLVIDPDYEEIIESCDSFISTEIATQVIKKINSFNERYAIKLKENCIDVNVKKYKHLPVLHGFCINREYLFFSLTSFENNELTGGYGTYIHANVDSNFDDLSEYYIKCFNDWFDYDFKSSDSI